MGCKALQLQDYFQLIGSDSNGLKLIDATERTLPMGQSESQQYNTLGQLTEKTDFKGQITNFIYDSLGRVNNKYYFAAGSSMQMDNVQVVYDELGRQQQIVEARGTTEFVYDSESRVTQIIKPEGTLNYEYDPVSGQHVSTWTAHSKTSYAYDVLGRLKTVSINKRDGVDLASPEVTTYNYSKVGSRESATLPDGTTTQYVYNNLNRLTQLTHADSTGAVLADYAYTLAPNGRRTAVAEQRREADSSMSNTNIAYTFDKMNRLVNEVSSSGINTLNYSNAYTYDLNSNRVKKVCTANSITETINYSYNANDQMTSEDSSSKGTTAYQYDTNGSLVSKLGSDESYVYAYNLQNRMSGAIISRQEDGQTVSVNSSYVYDQSGIRVKSNSTINGVVQNRIFLVDGMNHTGYAQILEEATQAGAAPIKSYVIGDDVLSQSVNGVVRNLLYDGHGSTRLLTASNGAVTNRYDYDTYGKMIGGNPGVTNPAATDLLYSGEQYDCGLQMQYLRARYYDQNTGRFNALDSFSGNNYDPQSLHKYAYCHADPVNGIDPSGEYTLRQLIVVLSIITITAFIILPVIFRARRRAMVAPAMMNLARVRQSMESVGFSNVGPSPGPDNALAHTLVLRPVSSAPETGNLSVPLLLT